MSQALQTPVVAQVEVWPLERVLPNPLNPRERVDAVGLAELVASVAAKGIVTPLLVMRRGDVVQVVSGHRRRAAAERARLRELPVIVVALTEQEQLELMIVENLQREDLTPLEEARAYQRALDGCPSKAELARRLGVELSRIEVRLALLRMDDATAKIFDRGEIPISFARALVKVSDPAERRRLVSLALQGRLNLRTLETALRTRAGSGAGRTAGASAGVHARAGGAVSEPLDAPPSELTRSEADELLKAGGGPVSFELLRRALKMSCPGCDEEKHADLCRACPLPSFIGEVVRRAGRGEG